MFVKYSLTGRVKLIIFIKLMFISLFGYRSLDLALFNSIQVYLYSAFYDTIVAKRFLTVCVCYSKSSTLI